MTHINLSDEKLVELSKNGDNKATETLILRYKNLVKAIARSYFLADGSPEDLLQEGDIGLFKAIEGFNGTSSFKSYAFICVKSAVLSAIKKSNSNKNKPLNNYLSISGVDGNDSDKSEFVIDSGFNPETGYINKESADELIKEIKDNLSGLEHKILTMYLQGYSYGEISFELNKPIKSIDNALQRIRKKLKVVFKT